MRHDTPERPMTLAGVLIILGLGLVPACSFSITYRIAQRRLINDQFGPGTYEQGVRVVGRYGKLSDGRELNSDRMHTLRMRSLMVSVLVATVYYALFKLLGLWPQRKNTVRIVRGPPRRAGL
jgi:hypothetical protein